MKLSLQETKPISIAQKIINIIHFYDKKITVSKLFLQKTI